MVAFAFSFLAFASATPLQRRCLPNFGGPEGLSIVNGVSEWVVAGTVVPAIPVNIGPSDSGPEFRVEFTGQPNNDFLIKCVDHINLCFGSGLMMLYSSFQTRRLPRAQSWYCGKESSDCHT
jgi:hypothetical protein